MQNVVAQRTSAEPSESQLPVPLGLEGAAVSQAVSDRSDQFDPKWLPPLPANRLLCEACQTGATMKSHPFCEDKFNAGCLAQCGCGCIGL